VAKLTQKQGLSMRKMVDEANIGLGEAGALTLANNKKMMVILDDREARTIAKSWNSEYTSTVMVPYEAFVRNLISYDGFTEDLTKLARRMWTGTNVITEVIKRAKKMLK
jgi:predicted nucleic acid-binding protein